jgi:hypothetical protein
MVDMINKDYKRSTQIYSSLNKSSYIPAGVNDKEGQSFNEYRNSINLTYENNKSLDSI